MIVVSGNPDVDGLTIPGSKASFDALNRLLTSGNKKATKCATGSSKITSTNSTSNFMDNLGLAAFVNTRVPSTMRSVKPSLLDCLDDQSEAGDAGVECGEDSMGTGETENGTPFTYRPTYVQWYLEDENYVRYAVVAVVLTSGIGTSENTVTPQVLDSGMVLRIHSYFPPALTSLRFFEKACIASKVPEFWVNHLIHVGKKEISTLVSGTKSSNDKKVKTYADINLKFECEQEIVHTIPILHKTTNCVIYVYILRKKRTAGDKVVLKKKKVLPYDSADESSDGETLGSNDSDTRYTTSSKKRKY